MIKYVYVVHSDIDENNIYDEFEFADEAIEYAKDNKDLNTYVDQIEVEVNDFGEVVDEGDTERLWSYLDELEEEPKVDLDKVTEQDEAELDAEYEQLVKEEPELAAEAEHPIDEAVNNKKDYHARLDELEAKLEAMDEDVCKDYKVITHSEDEVKDLKEDLAQEYVIKKGVNSGLVVTDNTPFVELELVFDLETDDLDVDVVYHDEGGIISDSLPGWAPISESDPKDMPGQIYHWEWEHTFTAEDLVDYLTQTSKKYTQEQLDSDANEDLDMLEHDIDYDKKFIEYLNYIHQDEAEADIKAKEKKHELDPEDIYFYEYEGDDRPVDYEFHENLKTSKLNLKESLLHEGVSAEAVAVVSELLQDEWEAISGYEDAAAKLEKLDVEDKEKVLHVLDHISEEESIHVGQLEQIVKLLNPEHIAKQDEGHKEGAEELAGENPHEEEVSVEEEPKFTLEEPEIVEVEESLNANDDYDIRNVRGHFEVYKNGKFILSADTESEAEKELDKLNTNKAIDYNKLREELEENEDEVECQRCFDTFAKEDCIKEEHGYICKHCYEQEHLNEDINTMLEPEPGMTIKINDMKGEPNYTGRTGVIEYIDSMGQLHGTWGGLAVIPEEDDFTILKDQGLEIDEDLKELLDMKNNSQVKMVNEAVEGQTNPEARKVIIDYLSTNKDIWDITDDEDLEFNADNLEPLLVGLHKEVLKDNPKATYKDTLDYIHKYMEENDSTIDNLIKDADVRGYKEVLNDMDKWHNPARYGKHIFEEEGMRGLVDYLKTDLGFEISNVAEDIDDTEEKYIFTDDDGEHYIISNYDDVKYFLERE